MTPLSSWVLCSKWFSPPKRFFDLQTVLYVGLTVSFRFFGKWLLLQKRFRAGFRQLCFTFISSVSSWGQSCVNCWHVSPIQSSSPQKTNQHVVAVGVFFGLILKDSSWSFVRNLLHPFDSWWYLGHLSSLPDLQPPQEKEAFENITGDIRKPLKPFWNRSLRSWILGHHRH